MLRTDHCTGLILFDSYIPDSPSWLARNFHWKPVTTGRGFSYTSVSVVSRRTVVICKYSKVVNTRSVFSFISIKSLEQLHSATHMFYYFNQNHSMNNTTKYYHGIRKTNYTNYPKRYKANAHFLK